MTTIDTDHRSLSPQIVTPDTDSQHVEYPPAIPRGKGDSHDLHSHPPPISLLTALLQQTSEHRSPQSAGQPPLSAGVTSAQSSVPSTAFSSPRNLPHGILQQGHTSDTQTANLQRRRSSAEADVVKDGVVGLGFNTLDPPGLDAVEEKRERIEWADRVDERGAPLRDGKLKFAVVHPESRSQSPIRPPLPEQKQKIFDALSQVEDEEDTDEGYQEDEEDGFDTDSDEGEDDLRYPFARPTNFDRNRFIGSTMIPVASPVPAPALLPPPSRRGRGHIRVDDPITSPGEQSKSCSRHRSPPPTPSRHSDATSSDRSTGKPRKSSNRLSDAGPRDGRAGSPMPQRLSSESDDEEEVDEFVEESAKPAANGMKGWRSDDAVFYGTKQVIPLVSLRHRRRSAGQARPDRVFADSDEEEDVEEGGGGSGLRGLLRRASEHIAGFARPTSPLPRHSSAEEGGSGRPSFSVSRPSQTLCPPALDDTPAMASGMSMADYGDLSGPLAHRLEASLNVQSE